MFLVIIIKKHIIIVIIVIIVVVLQASHYKTPVQTPYSQYNAVQVSVFIIRILFIISRHN